MKTLFKKLEHFFLFESTQIEKASIPYKTVISEANVKTNRVVPYKDTTNDRFHVVSTWNPRGVFVG